MKAKQVTAAELVKMSLLPPSIVREQRDMRIRFARSQGKTLDEIGKAYGLTRSRIQQICKKGDA